MLFIKIPEELVREEYISLKSVPKERIALELRFLEV